MTENKRFVAIGVEWTDGFIQDHIGDRDLFNISAVCNLLNELSEENEQLQIKIADLQYDNRNYKINLNDQKRENKELKQQLWNTTIDYYTETYSDNSIRRDEHINEFKKEFKAKYGDVE